LADEYAKRGQDWETQLRQRAKEIALMSELGLAIDTVTPNTNQEDADVQDEEVPADDA
jgi:capsid protein